MTIRDLVAFEKVEGKFIVKFKKPVQKYAKGYGFQLNISDATGSMMLKYWGPDNEAVVTDLYDKISEGDVISIKGKTTSYNNTISINVDSSGELKKLEKGEYDLSEFVRKSDRDPGHLFSMLNGFLNSVKDEEMKKIIGLFKDDEKFMEKFRNHPAAMYKHQGWIGGLMEHTVNMMSICETLSGLYPELDRDMMITGCFIHDIGKFDELDVSGAIKVTDDGMLIGHLVRGTLSLNERLKETDIEEKVKRKILHIAISHHGEKEYGSPKEPIFPEALAVSYADRTDALLSEMVDIKKNAKTEDDFFYTKDTGSVYLK